MRRTICVYAVLLGTAFSASSAWAISVSLGKGNQPVSGALYPAAASEYSGVALLSSAVSSCSGSAITRSVVLTAAHCYNAAGTANFPLYVNGQYSQTVSRKIVSTRLHPDYVIGGSAAQRSDIALFFLDTPLPGSIITYELARLTSVPVGSAVAVAGYGATGAGNASVYQSSRRSETFVDALGNRKYVPQLRGGTNRIEGLEVQGSVFATDFDAPGGTFGFGSREAGTAQGDSGSAVFYSEADALAGMCELNPLAIPCKADVKLLSDNPLILGVTSYGRSAGCDGITDYMTYVACLNRFGTIDGYVFASPYIEWIESVLGGSIASAPLKFVDQTNTYEFMFETSGLKPLDPLPAEPVAGAAPIASTGWLLLAGFALGWMPGRGRPGTKKPRGSCEGTHMGVGNSADFFRRHLRSAGGSLRIVADICRHPCSADACAFENHRRFLQAGPPPQDFPGRDVFDARLLPASEGSRTGAAAYHGKIYLR